MTVEKTLLQQLRHDLLFRARLSTPEVDALLAHPELDVDAAAPTPTQAVLRGILGESSEAAVLQAAIGTFHRDLLRPAGNETEVEPEQLPSELTVSDLDEPVLVTETVIDPSSLPPLEDAAE